MNDCPQLVLERICGYFGLPHERLQNLINFQKSQLFLDQWDQDKFLLQEIIKEYENKIKEDFRRKCANNAYKQSV